jgi:DNA-binding NtrC family response regulator
MENAENRPAVLVVDDEERVRHTLSSALDHSYHVYQAGTGTEAVDMVLHNSMDVVLLDILLPDTDGVSLLGRLRRTDPRLEVVMITAVNKVSTAVQAMKSGAHDYLVKPFLLSDVRNVIHSALDHSRARRGPVPAGPGPDREGCFENMISSHERMRRIFQFISRVADSEGPVLIQGESGTGKELVARAVHNRSHRREKPFKVVNCAAVPQALMERELFGHNRGAFTNAVSALPGKLEAAEGGTVFLDDIDTLDTAMQAKLLRVIQHREFERIGGNRMIRADIRFVAACNKDLKRLMSEGRFREDLFFRLNVFPVHLPPLRHRRSDIPLLLDHFVGRHWKRADRARPRFSREALKKLTRHTWPGNVRELENLVLHVCTVTRKSTVGPADLPLCEDPPADGAIKPLKQAVMNFERDYIGDVLRQVNGSRREAAACLHIHRNTLLGKIVRLGL